MLESELRAGCKEGSTQCMRVEKIQKFNWKLNKIDIQLWSKSIESEIKSLFKV